MRAKIAVSLIFAFICMVPAFGQDSGRGSAEAKVNGKTITITYGRPSLKGRDMLGQATVGTVWRLGMNQATEIATTGTLIVGGKELAPGKYSLWAKKTDDNTWMLEFHPKTGVWGAPPLTEGFVAETPLALSKASTSDEQLTISLGAKGSTAQVNIQWGMSVMSGTFGVK
jgi:hypothetical protein